MENIIFDTDPGVDDAITLLYAFGCNVPLNITLISTAGGNAPIESITENALHLLELFHKKIPVVKGAEKPLVRPAKHATAAQGKSGLGKYRYNRKKLSTHAVKGQSCDVMYETLKKTNGKTTIIAIGPMTNLALMIQKHPDCKKYIDRIIFESGTKEKIVGVPYKSFNVGYDPEAAQVVFSSGIQLVMIPMELGHFAYLDKEDIKRFKLSGKLGKIYAKMFKGYHDFHVGKLGAAVHDVCAAFFVTCPWFFKTEKAHIEVEYYDEKSQKIQKRPKNPTECIGFVNVDFDKTPNANICMDVDIAAFKEELFAALDRLSNVEE